MLLGTRSTHGWPLAFGLSGLLLFVGGPLHPRPDTTLDFFHSTASMLADPGWVPSHALMLASFAMLLLGLIGLVRSGRLSGRAAAAVRVAVAGTILGVVESVFHLASVADTAALSAGGPTPVLSAHLTLAIAAYPLMGFPLAALAWLGGRHLSHPLLSMVGVLGGILHGMAAPVVVLTQNQRFTFLFQGAVLLAIWLIAVGLAHLRTLWQRRAPARGPELAAE